MSKIKYIPLKITKKNKNKKMNDKNSKLGRIELVLPLTIIKKIDADCNKKLWNRSQILRILIERYYK